MLSGQSLGDEEPTFILFINYVRMGWVVVSADPDTATATQ
jgi:hypothetical protein